MDLEKRKKYMSIVKSVSETEELKPTFKYFVSRVPDIIMEDHECFPTLSSWIEMLNFYQSFHDYNFDDDDYVNFATELEKKMISLIEPLGHNVSTLENLDEWREREKSKLKTYTSPYLGGKKIFMTAVMKTKIDKDTMEKLKENDKIVDGIYESSKSHALKYGFIASGKKNEKKETEKKIARGRPRKPQVARKKTNKKLKSDESESE